MLGHYGCVHQGNFLVEGTFLVDGSPANSVTLSKESNNSTPFASYKIYTTTLPAGITVLTVL